jgi:hypothetical protein
MRVLGMPCRHVHLHIHRKYLRVIVLFFQHPQGKMSFPREQLERIWKAFICEKVMMRSGPDDVKERRGICIHKGVGGGEQHARPDYPFHIEFWIDQSAFSRSLLPL